MKIIRQHVGALAATAFAVFAMLVVSSVTFVAPTAQAMDQASVNCPDMSPIKPTPACTKNCVAVCHAFIIRQPVVAKTARSERATYATAYSRLTSVTVDGDDPPPRRVFKA